MKKVLIINTIGFGYEGISSVIFNYLCTMDTKDIAIDLVVYSDTPKSMVEQISEFVQPIELPFRKDSLINYLMALKVKIGEKGYDIVHIHGNSGTMLIEVLLAKYMRVKKIIVHVHNTKSDHPVINKLLKYPMYFLATDHIACSHAAGEWLYGRRKYVVLNNAIELKKFEFNQKQRDQMRKEFICENKYVIGHIGNFVEQKNHTFLIDIFQEYHAFNKDAYLLLGGTGPKIEDIKEKVKKLKLGDSVKFLGSINKPEKVYQAMDLFLFPSLWEGLPVVMLEAQANGLPVIASDVITREAKCIDSTKYVSLSSNVADWIKVISDSSLNERYDQNKIKKSFSNQGFDIENEAIKLREIYLS